MKKVLILYFSGAGSTKKVAIMIHSHIKVKCEADLCAIEQANTLQLNEYDGIIVGTPVYHAAPAEMVLAYFTKMHPLPRCVPAFLYNTRALWSGNTNRILAKHLACLHITTVLDRAYRSPASDGSLIVPCIKRFFEFDKRLERKVKRDSRLFLKRINDSPKGYIPRFHFSSVINAPNKLAGQLVTFPIHTHKDRCVQCGKCIKNCPYRAMEYGADGYACVLSSKCKNCYRCIHHCPAKALSLRKHRPPEKLLDFS